MSDKPVETVIWRADLAKRLHRSSETIRLWMRDGKLPKPDVDLSLKTRGWKLSTLRAAGIDLE